ncbi:MAG: LptF/LptG family permease [Armatimonadota bacterium]
METTIGDIARPAQAFPIRPLGMLDRFMLRELLAPFVFGILAFLSLLLGIDVLFDMIKLMVKEDFGGAEIARVFLCRLPSQILLTLPMSVLLACLYTFNRWSGDGEIVALQAAGVGFLRIQAPALAFAAAVSVFTYWFGDRVVPASNASMKAIIIAHRNRNVVKRDVVFYMPQEGPPQRIVYARTFSYEKGEMSGLTILEFSEGKLAAIIEAPAALWIGDSWRLRQPRFYTPQHYEMSLPPAEARVDHIGRTPREIVQRGVQPSEMTRRQLWAHVQRLRAQGANVLKVIVPYEIRYHLRVAMPFACFGFALIGAPLGMRRMRASAGVSVGLCIIIGFGYYTLFMIVSIFGQRGAISPLMTAWLPNIVLAALGVGLTAQAAR